MTSSSFHVPSYGVSSVIAQLAAAEERSQLTAESCSFCGKSYPLIDELIAGPNVYICDQCINLSSEIIKSRRVEGAK